MSNPIAFDLSRMIYGAASPAPRGIDRIDMGYARHLLGDGAGPNLGLIPSPAGMGAMTQAESLRFIGIVERHWREQQPAGEDGKLQRALDRLRGAGPAGGASAVRKRQTSGLPAAAMRYLKLVSAGRSGLFRSAAKAVPDNAVYLCIGQTALGFPWLFRWLDRRPDVKPVFMLHDLIPLVRPEFVLPPFTRHHARMVETAARRARGMIAISEASAEDLRQAIRKLGRADLPIAVIPHPVDDQFAAGRATAFADVPPYFVTVGTVDPRKNHRLLLHIWRRLAETGAGAVPKLVIAGGRGLRVAETKALLDRCPALKDVVIEVSGLSSPALRDLVAGARALLMPSFIEGFGLPIVEALALGTPVIASDIPAHREVAAGRATLLDPLDGPAWQAAILAGPRPAAAGYEAQTWAGYFGQVMPFLDSL